MIYKENPTDQDLVDFLMENAKVRKLTESECLRLMSFSEESIKAMVNAKVTKTLRNGSVSERPVAKTQLYKMAGNSIDCNSLRNLFRTLIIDDQPENEALFISEK